MRATTDSDGEIRFDVENKPGISNLLNIYSAFSGEDIDNIVAKYSGKGYGDFKRSRGHHSGSAGSNKEKILMRSENLRELIDILREGAEKAGAIAEKTMKRVKKNFGLGF